MEMPAYYHKAIEHLLQSHYPELGSRPFTSPLLQKWIRQLSDVLRSKKLSGKGAYFIQKELIAAYLSFLFPQSFIKVNSLLQEIITKRVFTGKKSLTIADIGCGIGASTFGAFEFFREFKEKIQVHFYAIDRNTEPLEIMQEIAKDKRFVENAHFTFIKTDVENLFRKTDKKWDIIILSLVMGELTCKISDIALVKKLKNHLTEEGLLIIIEPALQKSSMRLIELRNKLIKYKISILAPCLDENICPLSSDRKRWCYRELKWAPPASMEYLNRKLFREIDTLKFSYLVLAEKALPDQKKAARFRALSFPERRKGKYVLLICDSSCSLKIVELLQKDISDSNKHLLEISRGDLFSMSCYATAGSSIRLNKKSECRANS